MGHNRASAIISLLYGGWPGLEVARWSNFEVTLRRIQLVVGWMTVFAGGGRINSVRNQPPRPTQPGHPSVSRRIEYCRWFRPPLGKKQRVPGPNLTCLQARTCLEIWNPCLKKVAIGTKQALLNFSLGNTEYSEKYNLQKFEDSRSFVGLVIYSEYSQLTLAIMFDAHLHIRLNMPVLSKFDVRPAVRAWFTNADRWSRQSAGKTTVQPWFSDVFDLEWRGA